MIAQYLAHYDSDFHDGDRTHRMFWPIRNNFTMASVKIMINARLIGLCAQWASYTVPIAMVVDASNGKTGVGGNRKLRVW